MIRLKENAGVMINGVKPEVILALMIMMPILIFVADLMGVAGGMLIANIELELSPVIFLERFVEVVDIRHFWVGMIKGPFFA